MFTWKTVLRTASLMFVAACGPKAAEDGGESPEEVLTDACESFCKRSLACPLGRFAEEWDFQDEQACTSRCLEFHADAPSDPPELCLTIRAELWSCGAETESCLVYGAFEDIAFGIPNPNAQPCFDEVQEFLNKCNYF